MGYDPAILGCPAPAGTPSGATLNGTVLAILWTKSSVLCQANWSSAELVQRGTGQAAINAGDALYVKDIDHRQRR